MRCRFCRDEANAANFPWKNQALLIVQKGDGCKRTRRDIRKEFGVVQEWPLEQSGDR
jgi:hypothetical protein